MFAEAADEGIYFPGFAFHDQFNAAIVQISDCPGEGKPLSQVDGSHAKSDALDTPGKQNGAFFRHGGLEPGGELYGVMDGAQNGYWNRRN